MNLDFTPFTKINSKWIIDLNFKCKTLKFLDDNIEENLNDRGYGWCLFGYNTISMIHKRNHWWGTSFKLKTSAKDNVRRMRRPAKGWEKIFAKDTSNKGLLSKIHKEHLKLHNKKTAQLKNGLKNLNRHLIKEDIQMKNKHMKSCSTSYVLRECKVNNNEILLCTC